MEPTSTPDNGRQSRGLARFWPVHGTPAPGQRHSDDESVESEADESPTPEPLAGADAGPVAGSGPTGDQPQVDAVRPAPRAGETHLLALGSRRLPEIVNGGRPSAEGRFPPPETERDARAAEPAPRHGGPPIPTALPPQPPSRSPFGTMGPAPDPEAASPFRPAPAPFAPASPFGPRPPRRSSGGPATGRFETSGPPAASSSTHDTAGRDTADRDRDARHGRAAHGTASGWASLPTSGIPTLATGNPVAGGPTPVSTESLDGNAAGDAPAGGRRDRDEEPRTAAARRSTTLDDADDPRPRAGRRAAPEIADDMEGRTDRPPDSGDGEDAVKLDDQAPAGPGADRNIENVASADRADGEPVSAGPDESAQADVSAPAETAGVDTVREPGDDTVRETEGDDSAGETGAGGSAGETDGDDTVRQPGAATKADAPMRPGDVDETLIAFWDEKAVHRFRTEWHEVKADFVDDPIAALTRAHDLVTEAVDDLTEALLAERDELDPLRDTSTPDTESMRMAMRGYREFMDRILAL